MGAVGPHGSRRPTAAGDRLMRTALVVIAALAGAALTAPACAQALDPRAVPVITVTGEGVASVKPDVAVVTSGVVTRAAKADVALKANSAAMTSVLAALKAAKVEDRDVATAGLTVQPQYDYGSGSAPAAPKLAGYEVRNTVTIRVRALDGLGALLDQLVAAGSNQIEGLAFDVADDATPSDAARRDAVLDARRKATLFAEAAGATLGPVLGIDEQDESSPPVRPFAARAKALDAAPAVPIAQGEQDLRARVTVRWALER